MAQDLASDFNSEKDTDSIRGIFDFYDAFDRGYITHQQLRYNQCYVMSFMSHRSCDVWTYVFIQEIRERNRSMSLIIRDLKNGSNRPVSLGTVIVSHISYPNLILVSSDRSFRKRGLNVRILELPWKWAKDWMKLKSPNSLKMLIQDNLGKSCMNHSVLIFYQNKPTLPIQFLNGVCNKSHPFWWQVQDTSRLFGDRYITWFINLKSRRLVQ